MPVYEPVPTNPQPLVDHCCDAGMRGMNSLSTYYSLLSSVCPGIRLRPARHLKNDTLSIGDVMYTPKGSNVPVVAHVVQMHEDRSCDLYWVDDLGRRQEECNVLSDQIRPCAPESTPNGEGSANAPSKRLSWLAFFASCPQEEKLLIALVMFVLAACIAWGSLEVSDREMQVKQWAARTWVSTSCNVISTGIQYKGACPNVSGSANIKALLRPKFHYSKVDKCWQDRSTCQKAIHKEYKYSEPVPRRLRMHVMHHGGGGSDAGGIEPCNDMFFPWALVQVEGQEFCASEYGYNVTSQKMSFTKAKAVAQRLKDQGSKIRCWLQRIQAGKQKCYSVATEDPGSWEEVTSWQAWFEELLRPLVLWCATMGCLLVAFTFLVMACCCQHKSGRLYAHPAVQNCVDYQLVGSEKGVEIAEADTEASRKRASEQQDSLPQKSSERVSDQDPGMSAEMAATNKRVSGEFHSIWTED